MNTINTVQALIRGRWKNMAKVVNNREARMYADHYARMYGGGRVKRRGREVYRQECAR